MSRRNPNQRELRAFSGGSAMHIHRAIAGLAWHVRCMSQYEFTSEELQDLFVARDHRVTLREAYRLTTGGIMGTQNLHIKLNQATPLVWEKPLVSFRFNHQDAPDGFLVPTGHGYSPHAPATCFQPGADLDTQEKFNAMVEHELRVSYEFGLVRHVFQHLNAPDACTTPAQMRYLWPCLVPLLRVADEDDLARQLAEPSARAGDKAVCPTHLVPHIKTTYDIVAKAMLLKEIEPVAQKQQAYTYNLYQPKFEFMPGLTFDGL